MLTLLALLQELSRYYYEDFKVYRIHIPKLFIFCFIGFLVGIGISTLHYSNQWPVPNFPLDLDGIVQVRDNSDELWETIEGVAVSQEDQFSSEIPAELYPELAYIGREPMQISRKVHLPEDWDEVHDNTRVASANKVETKVKEQIPVPLEKGIKHVLRAGENPWILARRYRVSHKKLLAYNPELNPKKLKVGDKIIIPGAKDPILRTRSTKMRYPLKSKRITSKYGMRKHPIGGDIRFHKGLDFGANIGTPIYAVLDGFVKEVGRRPVLGNYIILKHTDGLETVYGHNNKNLVKRGEHVRQGDQIAQVGRTGMVTGPHVHFEVVKNGRHQNPISYLNGQTTINQVANR